MNNPGRVNPALIGGFVLAVLLLGAVALFYLSEGGLATRGTRYILYFQSDIKGLQVGAPVNFRGVKIGQVESMSITYESQTRQFRIPVVISIDDRKVGFAKSQRESHGLLGLRSLIKEGLRARLKLQSLVTGKLEIELDFAPDTEVRLVGGDKRYEEIPTVQSNLEKIANAFEELPMERITRHVSEMLDSIDKVLADGEVPRMIETFIRVTRRLDSLSAQLEQAMPKLLSGSQQTIESSRALVGDLTATTRDLHETIRRAGSQLDGAFASWDRTMASGQAAMDQARQAAGSADKVVQLESPVVSEMTKTLRELGAAARAIRLMSEYLERHPDALLRGKQ